MLKGDEAGTDYPTIQLSRVARHDNKREIRINWMVSVRQ